LGKLFLILSNRVRIRILKELAVKGRCSFSQLHSVCEVPAGTLAYHLDVLKELVSKEDKDYCLTEMGRHACNILEKVEDLDNVNKLIK